MSKSTNPRIKGHKVWRASGDRRLVRWSTKLIWDAPCCPFHLVDIKHAYYLDFQDIGMPKYVKTQKWLKTELTVKVVHGKTGFRFIVSPGVKFSCPLSSPGQNCVHLKSCLHYIIHPREVQKMVHSLEIL